MQPVVAMDRNTSALGVYKANFPGATTLDGNLESWLDSPLGDELSAVETIFADQVGEIDLLIGGPPCQGHSDLNNHTRRADPKNSLYQRMARFAEVAMPNNIIIENVSAVLHDKNDVVTTTKLRLLEIGYNVDDAVIEIAKLGLPQDRKRHVLVASRVNEVSIENAIADLHHPPRSVKWAIGDLRQIADQSVFNSSSKAKTVNQSRIDYLFDHDIYDLPNSQRPDCHKNNPNHSYKAVYGRLHWDKAAPTITGGYGCMGQGRFVHPRERRTLTPHEAARLQSIPDFYSLSHGVGRTALAEIIGNAVPPKLSYALALDLLR